MSDRGIKVLIVNNSGFEKYLSPDVRKKMNIIEVSKESCYPTEIVVKYFHLIPGFSEDPILGYKFDRISDPKISLSTLGINPDLYLRSMEPETSSHGLLDREYIKSLEDKVNTKCIVSGFENKTLIRYNYNFFY